MLRTSSGSEKQPPRDVVVTVASISEKKEIMSQSEKLKLLTNSLGKKYYVRDYYTPQTQEMRRKGQDVAERMAENDSVNQEEVATVGSKVYVGDKEYKPKVQPPDPTKVLAMPMEKLNKIMSMPALCGDTVQVGEGNFFTGYIMDTVCFEEIRDAYMKIRLNHADARHIVCAWSVPGVDNVYCEDGCDDEDYGASRIILNMMREHQITHRVIYVVRVCGNKLNSERFPSYLKAAMSVVNKYPVNAKTGTSQRVKITEKENGVGLPNKDSNQRHNVGSYANALKSRGGGSRGTRGRGRGGHGRGRGRGSGNRRGRGGVAPTRGTIEGTKTVMQFLPRTEEEINKQLNPVQNDGQSGTEEDRNEDVE